ncbi:MAG: HEAT repeat domain-containing protein, partial [Phycisphaerales bacterium]|nr:HEAT repeat domain-containing protein [Phycisphaerales bacterium]
MIVMIVMPRPVIGATAADEIIPSLAEAPAAERAAVDRFITSSAWAHRAMAALRLERYRDDDSRLRLEALLRDDVWQVRAFAIRALRWRGDDVRDLVNNEAHPRVVRTALRHHVTIDPERIRRGVEYLARSTSADERLLAVEIAVASQDEELAKLAEKTLKTVITRMERAEAGTLSPRLARVTGSEDLHRDYRWRNWLLKNSLRLNLRPGFAFDKESLPTTVNGIA